MVKGRTISCYTISQTICDLFSAPPIGRQHSCVLLTQTKYTNKYFFKCIVSAADICTLKQYCYEILKKVQFLTQLNKEEDIHFFEEFWKTVLTSEDNILTSLKLQK